MCLNGLNDVLFANTIKSDGFIVDFLFEKRRATAFQESKKDIENHGLALEDLMSEGVESIHRPAFIDTRQKAVFTAAVGLGDDHQVRRCITKEYYDLTGPTKYSIRLQRLKDDRGITPIETHMPTAKTR